MKIKILSQHKTHRIMTLCLALASTAHAQAQREESPCDKVYKEVLGKLGQGGEQTHGGDASRNTQNTNSQSEMLEEKYQLCRQVEDTIMGAHQEGNEQRMRGAQAEAESYMNAMRSLAPRGELPQVESNRPAKPNTLKSTFTAF